MASSPCGRIILLFAAVMMFVATVGAQAPTIVAAGGLHTLVVRADGTLWTMGNNDAGQLGDGTRTRHGTPVQVATEVKAVAGGFNHSLFVRADGTLWAMGSNREGELGDGTMTERWIPVQVASGVTAVAGGSEDSYFIKTDGTLWAMGANFSGELGDGTVSNRLLPIRVADGVVSVSAGASFAVFRRTDGTVWAMGRNADGQFGNGTTTDAHVPILIASGMAAAAAGGSHTLLLGQDGTLWAMGANNYGQLGDGTTVARTARVPVASGVVAAAGGGDHSLFVKADGTLWASGYNYSGQLGDGTKSNRSTPVLIAAGVSSVSAGRYHTMFIKQGGTLWSTGANLAGELGYGPLAARPPPDPVQVMPWPTALGVEVLPSAGAVVFTEARNVPATAIVLDPALTITTATPTLLSVAVSLDGVNYPFPFEELAFHAGSATGNIISLNDPGRNGTIFLRSPGGTATLAEWQAALRSITYANWSDTPDTAGRQIQYVVNNGTAISVVASRSLTVNAVNDAPIGITLSSHAIDRGGGVDAVVGVLSATDPDSTNFTYALVDGPGAEANASFRIDGVILRAKNTTAIAPGRYSVRLQADDGAGGTLTRPFVLTVTESSDHVVKQVSAGPFATSFVTTDGTLWEIRHYAKLPVPVAYGVASVAVGSGPAMALKKDGTLWALASNAYAIDPSADYVQVASGVAAVAVGGDTQGEFAGGVEFIAFLDYRRTLFVRTDGSLWGFGANTFGQLGDGTRVDRAAPVMVASNVASVSAGGFHTVFVKADGTLWATGRNDNGELGDGTTTTRAAPVLIASGVRSAAAGSSFTLFVKTDGTLWATGANTSGQLGDGTTVGRSSPLQIATGVTAVAAGNTHALFITTGGGLWAMGENTFGQLGDGTTTARSTPVQVATDVSAVSAGYNHTHFVKTNGTLWGMGGNLGQLGDGTTTARSLPVPVLHPNAMIAQPVSQTVEVGRNVMLTATAPGDGGSSLWHTTAGPVNEGLFGSLLFDAPDGTLFLPDVQPAHAGLYWTDVSGSAVTSELAIVGVSSTAKVIGAAEEIQADIPVAATGHVYDQVLLQGAAAAITADYALHQITRLSFIDLSDDIVQVEMSGPGTLSIVLDGASAPALPLLYNQDVKYVKGHATIIIADATADTNVTVFSIGRATAVNQGLFKAGVTYDGMADIAFIAISSRDGKFGGIRTGNASYLATKGPTGIYAPGVTFTGPVYIGEISASDTAMPVIITGSSSDTRITGGGLLQPNGRPIRVAGIEQLNFTAGQNSHGIDLAAQANHGVLQEDGVDVTDRIATHP